MIQSQTRIPILLPSKLPSGISERDIKLASGKVREDGYFISLYFSEAASDAVYAAGFGGSTRIFGRRRSAEYTPGGPVGRSHWDVQGCFMRWLPCTGELVVGAERRHVSNPSKAAK